MDAATKMGFMNEQSTNLKLKTGFLAWKECENTHTLTMTTTGSKTSQKEVNNQIDNQNHNALCPPKVSSLQVLSLV